VLTSLIIRIQAYRTVFAINWKLEMFLFLEENVAQWRSGAPDFAFFGGT
jgi:hypothetical protein